MVMRGLPFHGDRLTQMVSLSSGSRAGENRDTIFGRVVGGNIICDPTIKEMRDEYNGGVSEVKNEMNDIRDHQPFPRLLQQHFGVLHDLREFGRS